VAHLHIARSYVVDDRVAENVRHRSCARDVLAALADDHGQFGFVVDLRRHLGRHEHVVVRADNALGHLGEDDGLLIAAEN